MRQFDTKVQYLKYRVLREVATYAYENKMERAGLEIPEKIVTGEKATMRCCVYKERAIVGDRIALAMGGDQSNPNVIEVLPIACDECPVGGVDVTEACRGCIAHRCERACKLNAITFDANQRAHINKEQCVECGKCAEVCPYGAISHHRRPCEKACKVKAIRMDEDKKAAIIEEKCIGCGACIYQCPFGAIMDKSYLLKTIAILLESKRNPEEKIYAVVAPSIAGQFSGVKLSQLVKGLMQLGFHKVVEAALGADLVAYHEARELVEKGFLFSSCCPAFVSYVKSDFPKLSEHLSENLSPMAAIAKKIKETDSLGKVVFIGPCTAKKHEMRMDQVSPFIDSVLTFEELQALLDSREISLETLEEVPLDNASYYGRIFARSSGLSEAVAQSIKEQALQSFEYKPMACNGIEECKKALLQVLKGNPSFNFIEGMACVGGCIGGAGCLSYGEKNKNEVDRYGKEAMEKTISSAIGIFR